ncbi:MAG TPA: hypothetical protein VMS93_04765 [Candidatus Saccharimonadales bacterium]|nr:hypothetical protein [Candidatus Saccharimonadales bacterium]
MRERRRGARGTMIAVVMITTLAAGAALIYLADTLVLGVRLDTAPPSLLLNEGLLLLSLVVLQGLVIGVLAGRLLGPLRRLAGVLDGDVPAGAGAGAAPRGSGEVRELWRAGVALVQRHEEGRRALEELARVQADAERLRQALAQSDRLAPPALSPSAGTLSQLARQLELYLREIREWREENAAVAVQIETEGRQAVLAAREAASHAEAAYLEASELGVALRDLSRVIAEVRPVLEAERAPAGASEEPGASLAEVCRMLADIADRHRGFALRISREWARGPGAPPEFGVALMEDLNAHLEAAERRRTEAERRLSQAPDRAGELSPPVRAALKKLLQSAEISGERLVRLTAAAERASSAARRATGLAERELQNLEALGVRLEGESGPVDPAETLGESDFVVEPER